jgi:hypothetical protein
MSRPSLVSRRLFLLASGGAAGASVLAACETASNFVYEPLASGPPPVKIQRLLLWLPTNDDVIDGRRITAEFVRDLAPYGVAVEAGRANRLQISRADDQREIVQRFQPNYRLEIGFSGGHRATYGSASSLSTLVQAQLYRGASATVLARFSYHAQSRDVPRFVQQVVENLKTGGYL